MFGILGFLCGIFQGVDFLPSRLSELFGAESPPGGTSKSKVLSHPDSSPVRASPGSEKSDRISQNPAHPSEAESQWLTDLLRQEFQRWLTSRSEALFNQLQMEFGQWLALRGSPSNQPSEDPNRPAWVDAPPGVIDGQYGQTVQAGPAPSLEDCQAELRSEIQKAVASYAEKRFDSPLAHQISWNIEPLLRELVADQWQQTRLIDFGPNIGRKPMIWLYARLRFTPPVQQEIARQYREAVIQRRLHTLAGFGAGLLVLLGISYGVLRWQCNRLYPPKAS